MCHGFGGCGPIDLQWAYVSELAIHFQVAPWNLGRECIWAGLGCIGIAGCVADGTRHGVHVLLGPGSDMCGGVTYLDLKEVLRWPVDLLEGLLAGLWDVLHGGAIGERRPGLFLREINARVGIGFQEG